MNIAVCFQLMNTSNNPPALRESLILDRRVIFSFKKVKKRCFAFLQKVTIC